jgi:hypothetical protein
MLSKKMLTLACVAGILAFGGCIFIPTGPAPPPTAPRLEFQGIHNIQVSATNTSDSQHIDPSDLARAVARSINDDSPGTGIKAQVQQDAAATDASLKITILSEIATTPPDSSSAKTASWKFQFRISAVLTKSDGQVVWTETNELYQYYRPPYRKDPDDPWGNPALRRSLPPDLAFDLVFAMFYKK